MRRMWWRWLDDEFTFTKRQLGALLVAAGIVAVTAMLAAEALDADSGGFGLVQRAGTAIGVLAVLLGLTLLPLGDRPA